ncbi:MAG: GNAT family N-acetyltransferase [Blastomonas sp.]
MSVRVETLDGGAIAAVLDDLAALRITVFREWPYLYDGDAGYERAYLAEFAAAPNAALVVARDGARIVGAATASPMTAQKAQFRAPFEERGIDTAALFYFGESVLLPDWRGQGIGKAFFDHREAAARAAGALKASFCAVERPLDHPARPADYRPLDGFWRARGYAPVPGFVTEFPWRDLGDEEETLHPMQYWLGDIVAVPVQG